MARSRSETEISRLRETIIDTRTCSFVGTNNQYAFHWWVWKIVVWIIEILAGDFLGVSWVLCALRKLSLQELITNLFKLICCVRPKIYRGKVFIGVKCTLFITAKRGEVPCSQANLSVPRPALGTSVYNA
jgi:hypothetical protein